jgi:hypothetical protein
MQKTPSSLLGTLASLSPLRAAAFMADGLITGIVGLAGERHLCPLERPKAEQPAKTTGARTVS